MFFANALNNPVEPRPMYYYSTIPLIGHPPVPPFAATMQFYNPTPDSDLYSQIVKQIHYYFRYYYQIVLLS